MAAAKTTTAAPKAQAAAPAPKAEATGTVTIRQTGSPLRRPETQRATLIGLGLNKMGREATLQDTPSIRGAIRKVQHLVQVIEK